MSTIWNSGDYTPDNTVLRIIDNVTPVNKNSIRNSIGQEISLIQNYVNSTYLGRSDTPVQSGYIQSLISNSGVILIYNSGTYDIDDSITITPSSMILYHQPTNPYEVNKIITPTGLYLKAINGFYETNRRIIDFNPNRLYLHGADPSTLPEGSVIWDTIFIPYSGLNIRRTDLDVDACNRTLDLSVSGISWGYTSNNGFIANTSALNVDSSGNIISFPSGQFVIGSGVPYENCKLTIGATDGNGDLFVRTHGGGGLLLAGDNGTIDRIYSYGNILYISTEGGINTNNIILNNSNESCTINANTIQDSYTSIIASGEAYDHCALTVGRINQSGDLFVRTSNGGGLHLRGDNASIDRITSYASSHLALENDYSQIIIPASGAITLPANATDTASSYALVNAIKDLLIQRGWASE